MQTYAYTFFDVHLLGHLLRGRFSARRPTALRSLLANSKSRVPRTRLTLSCSVAPFGWTRGRIDAGPPRDCSIRHRLAYGLSTSGGHLVPLGIRGTKSRKLTWSTNGFDHSSATQLELVPAPEYRPTRNMTGYHRLRVVAFSADPDSYLADSAVRDFHQLSGRLFCCQAIRLAWCRSPPILGGKAEPIMFSRCHLSLRG